MTKEEILAALRNLQSHAISNTSEQQQAIDNETAELDTTIEEYNEKIAELEVKLADMDNYQYEEVNKEERELTEELLEESFAHQIETLDKEDIEYKQLQDLATSIFTDYNEEIALLNVDIAAIERRLRKNDIAVSKNIGIKLTDEELANLNSTLEAKKARVIECEKYKLQYTEELSNYGELITANNRKREIVMKKQEKLAAIKAERAAVKTVDNYKLQRDKDELASLKAGLLALQSRKEYINFNMKSEIDKLIAETETLDFNSQNEQDKNVEQDEVALSDFADDNEFIQPGFTVNNHVFDDEPEKTEDVAPLGIPEETSAHDIWSHSNMFLDNEREAEIEEAKEELKKKKKDGFFKKNWKKVVAVGIAVVTALLVMKGCHDIKNANPKDIDDIKNSYTQEDTIEAPTDDIDSKYEIPADTNVNTEIKSSTPVVASVEKKENPTSVAKPMEEKKVEEKKDTTSTEKPVVEKKDTTPTEKLAEDKKVEEKKDTTPTEKPVVEKKVEEKKDTTPTEKLAEDKKVVELNSGDKMISVNDLFNDNITDETVISHGDAIGTTTDSAELTDYTEEGKAVVEYTAENEDTKEDADSTLETKTAEETDTETKTMTKEEYKELLDKLSGGTGVLTPEGEQWLDELASGKTR